MNLRKGSLSAYYRRVVTLKTGLNEMMDTCEREGIYKEMQRGNHSLWKIMVTRLLTLSSKAKFHFYTEFNKVNPVWRE